MADTLKLEVLIRPYEVDGDDKRPKDGHELRLKPHWNIGDWIVVAVGDIRITVRARDLERALRACQQ